MTAGELRRALEHRAHGQLVVPDDAEVVVNVAGGPFPPHGDAIAYVLLPTEDSAEATVFFRRRQ